MSYYYSINSLDPQAPSQTKKNNTIQFVVITSIQTKDCVMAPPEDTAMRKTSWNWDHQKGAVTWGIWRLWKALWQKGMQSQECWELEWVINRMSSPCKQKRERQVRHSGSRSTLMMPPHPIHGQGEQAAKRHRGGRWGYLLGSSLALLICSTH